MDRAPKPLDQRLFVSEVETAYRLGQTLDDWKAKSIVLERGGLPKIDPLMGGRYWPAIKSYFDRYYGVSNVGSHQLDGKENLDAL